MGMLAHRHLIADTKGGAVKASPEVKPEVQKEEVSKKETKKK